MYICLVSAEIADLRIVCNIDSKEITIKEIPNLCTALSLSVNYASEYLFTCNIIKTIA